MAQRYSEKRVFILCNQSLAFCITQKAETIIQNSHVFYFRFIPFLV